MNHNVLLGGTGGVVLQNSIASAVLGEGGVALLNAQIRNTGPSRTGGYWNPDPDGFRG